MSDTAKHTPGPLDWMSVQANASGGFHLYLIDSNERKIAALWGGADEKVANAKLFSVAPELLEALEHINRRASPAPDRTLGDCADELMRIADIARAAIAAARASL